MLSILYVKLDYLSNVKNRPVLAYRTALNISEDIHIFQQIYCIIFGTV
nr:MAG TPA: hypothetical protein [Siphoviridae sp. ctqOv4]DAZ28723.1 MAG TPA: hypothetical protein [Caudoviricetes sp.]